MLNWRTIYSKANLDVANPIEMLEKLNSAIDMCLNGCYTEKATAKGEVLTVLERHPAAVAQLVKAQITVLQYISSQTEEEAPTAQCTLIIEAANDSGTVNSTISE